MRPEFRDLLGKIYRIILISVLNIILISFFYLISQTFASVFCPTSALPCLAPNDKWPAFNFFLMSALRAFTFTPLSIVTSYAAFHFSLPVAIILSSLGAVLSAALIYLPARAISRRFFKVWLSSNLPATLQHLRSRSYKVTVFARMNPLIPFDLVSFAFGVGNVSFRDFLVGTFIGVLPVNFLIVMTASMNFKSDMQVIMFVGSALCLFNIAIILSWEIFERLRGMSVVKRFMELYHIISSEVRTNNEITKRGIMHKDREVVILMYGFFSSRRTLTILERHLTSRGFQVITFNLGGVFDVFFTQSIPESAKFLDEKIKRQLARHQISRVHIVAHSKGGLVASWWVLKLGGYQYCNKLITLGTPFQGSWLTYFGLITPIGFLWEDLWEMRPRSRILKDLYKTYLPQNLKLYCFYSLTDKIAGGIKSIYKNRLFQKSQSPQVIPVGYIDVSHFHFLARRDIADKIAEILSEDKTTAAATGTDSEDPTKNITQIVNV